MSADSLSAVVFTLCSYSKALEYRFRAAGSLIQWSRAFEISA
jgi:hypothetical protein